MYVDRRPSAVSALDVTGQVLALADRLGHVVEGQGEVTADLSIDVDGADDPLEVLARHSRRPWRASASLGSRPTRISRSTRRNSSRDGSSASWATLSSAAHRP